MSIDMPSAFRVVVEGHEYAAFDEGGDVEAVDHHDVRSCAAQVRRHEVVTEHAAHHKLPFHLHTRVGRLEAVEHLVDPSRAVGIPTVHERQRTFLRPDGERQKHDEKYRHTDCRFHARTLSCQAVHLASPLSCFRGLLTFGPPLPCCNLRLVLLHPHRLLASLLVVRHRIAPATRSPRRMRLIRASSSVCETITILAIHGPAR